jgi:monovalent cation:H+ antiporter, CPA1 family
MIGHEIFGILISLTAISSYINYKYIKLPKSIGITSITLFLSLIIVISSKLGINVEYSKKLLDSIKFNETFLHGMLSFLLFAGSLHVNVIELSRYKVLITLLATVSVLFSTFLVGYIVFWLTQILCINLPFYYCFVFGALISPTDPIAVLGVLKTVKAPRSLELKIAGEALFNDGMGIVLFFVALALTSGAQNSLSLDSVLFYFIRQGLGGLVLGFIIGFFASKILKTVNDSEVAIIITLSVVSGGYTLAHSVLEVSGPICMATAGLVIGNAIKYSEMTEETVLRLSSFWELLDEVFNAILFVLIGLEFIGIQFNLYTTLSAIGVIIITIFARCFSILIPVVGLSHFKVFNMDLLIILTWGGLRGGISIALALSVDGIYHDFLVAITYSVVIFSMMVQGVTIGPLVKRFMKKQNAK